MALGWDGGGNEEGDGVVKDGANDLFIAQMFAAGNSVYFFSNADAPGEAGGRELWKVAPDGPGAYKAVLVKDIVPGAGGSQPANMASFNGKVFFSAATGASNTDREPWLSDGTAAGTARLADLNPGQPSGISTDINSYIWRRTAELGGRLYFSGINATKGEEVASTDGTGAGTTVLTDIVQGAGSALPRWLTTYDDYVYFSAQGAGGALWRTNGTTTEEVKTQEGNSISGAIELVQVSESLFMFAAAGGVWKLTDDNDPPGSGGSIGDWVWDDVNANGIQDDGAGGIDGVTVNLIDGAGNPLQTTTTSGGGFYLFAGLAAGTYAVEFVAPSGYSFGQKDNPSTTEDLDSDADPVSGRTGNITLGTDEQLDDIDAGLYSSGGSGGSGGSISGVAWEDTDADGIRDPGEPLLSGVAVTLHDEMGAIETVFTEPDGSYVFSGLGAGVYWVEFFPGAMGFTTQDKDQNQYDSVDSDVDQTGFTAQLILDPDKDLLNIDAGYLPP